MFAELLTIFNILVGLLAFALNLRYTIRSRSRWRIVKLMTGLSALYMAVIYLVIFLGWVNDVDPISFGQSFVRPAVALLLLSIASGAMLNPPK